MLKEKSCGKNHICKGKQGTLEQVTSAVALRATWVFLRLRGEARGRAANLNDGIVVGASVSRLGQRRRRSLAGSGKQLGTIVLLLLSHNYWNNYTFFAETL